MIYIICKKKIIRWVGMWDFYVKRRMIVFGFFLLVYVVGWVVCKCG